MQRISSAAHWSALGLGASRSTVVRGNAHNRTSLKAGRSYTITLDFHPNSEVALTDAKGKVLASARPAGDDSVVKLAGVKVQATGTYFLVARGLDAGGGYTLPVHTLSPLCRAPAPLARDAGLAQSGGSAEPRNVAVAGTGWLLALLEVLL